MRINLLVTLGILGSSSLALADHGGREVRTSRRDNVSSFERGRFDAPRREVERGRFDAPRRSTTWRALTSIERLGRRGDVFDVHARERFGQLRLQNQTGRTFVRAIEIEFSDGARQRVRVNQALDGNHAMVNIDLDGGGRRIERISVDGRSERGGAFQLYAM